MLRFSFFDLLTKKNRRVLFLPVRTFCGFQQSLDLGNVLLVYSTTPLLSKIKVWADNDSISLRLRWTADPSYFGNQPALTTKPRESQFPRSYGCQGWYYLITSSRSSLGFASDLRRQLEIWLSEGSYWRSPLLGLEPRQYRLASSELEALELSNRLPFVHNQGRTDHS